MGGWVGKSEGIAHPVPPPPHPQLIHRTFDYVCRTRPLMAKTITSLLRHRAAQCCFGLATVLRIGDPCLDFRIVWLCAESAVCVCGAVGDRRRGRVLILTKPWQCSRAAHRSVSLRVFPVMKPMALQLIIYQDRFSTQCLSVDIPQLSPKSDLVAYRVHVLDMHPILAVYHSVLSFWSPPGVRVRTIARSSRLGSIRYQILNVKEFHRFSNFAPPLSCIRAKVIHQKQVLAVFR